MRRLALLILPLLLACCYDSAGEPGHTPDVPDTSVSLAEIRRLYAGKPFEITVDMFVQGIVTSHDQAGNFYRTLVIESDGAAAELMAGIDGLHNIYPVGCSLTIGLKGLAIGESHGVLQIGRKAAAGSGYPTDYIGSRAALDIHVFRGEAAPEPQPLATHAAALTPEMAGRLVRIDALRYSPEELDESLWSGTHRFIDANNCAIYTYTRPYADFAGQEIPTKEVVLTGILQCDPARDGTTRYTLRLRDENDCLY